MRSRLEDLPRYRTREDTLSAASFNQGRLALRRLGRPLRFPLPGLRTLEMVLDTDLWVCLDAGLSDFPVIAWLDFQAARSSLHEPIPCRVYTYHAHAEVVEPQILEKTAQVLSERLRRRAAGEP